MFLNGFKIYRAAENESGSSSNENPVTSDEKSIVDVLHFDPFKAGEEIPEVKADPKPSGNDNAKPSGEGNVNAGQPASPPANSAPETKPAASPTPGQDDQVKHWQALAEHYKGLVEKPAPKSEEVDNGPKVPAYNFEIPEQLVGALTSQDAGEFKKGLVAFAKGIAGAVHAQMASHMEAAYNPRFEQVPAMIQKVLVAQEQAKHMNADFYGKYPELDQPAIRAVVRQTAESVAAELGIKSWNEQLRDETAKRVKGILMVAAGMQPSQTPPANQQTPPRMLGGQGARPAVNTNDESRDIVDTLFSGF